MTIIYSYAADDSNGNKYYQIEASKEDKENILTYIDLIGMHYYDLIGYSWGNKHDIELVKQYRKYFLDDWYGTLKVRRDVIKELKKAKIVETRYRYKKDKK